MEPRITFIARHYPPSPNINGESVWDMVKYLQDNSGIHSNVICIDRSFAGGGHRRESVGNVIRLRTLYEGKNPVFRFFTFLYDGFILCKKALQFKDTLLVCTTSPPALPFWASSMFGKKLRWAVWFFDLFPEGFTVTGVISEKNIFYRWVVKRTYRNQPSFLIALGPKQAAHLQQKYGANVPSLILPCGVFFYQERSEEAPHWWREGKIYLGYCGNVGDPHNPDFIKAAIDNIDPEKHCLILALYGIHAPQLKEYAQDKPGVVVVDNVPRSQLHYIDVHLVSLRREWTHIAVPSKAVSAVSLGAAILFCGSEESDNWYLLQKAGWFIDERSALQAEVKKMLDSLTPEEIALKKQESPALYEQLKQYVLDTYKSVSSMVIQK